MGTWTIMSPMEIKERFAVFCAEGQTNVVPFAFRYHGLGHVRCLSYCPERACTFEHWDGGSNGFDRDANFQKLVATTPTNVTPVVLEDVLTQA